MTDRVMGDDGALLAEVTRRLGAGEAVVLATAVRTTGTPPCRPGQKLVAGRSGPVAGTLGCAELDTAAVADTPDVLADGEPRLVTYVHELGEVEVHLEPYAPASRLVVMSATPVARWLLRWGRDLGYATVLVEPRAERVDDELRTLAGTVVNRVDAALTPGGPIDAVHTDHDAPLVAEHLAAALHAGARFVGLIGSRRHAASHLDALRAVGVADADVARVQTPVGLDLGGKSAPEIALSILAGIVAAGHGRAGGWLSARPDPTAPPGDGAEGRSG
jgi:xanthine/CO dehydrogenase XdhC/CoxF family maturation factor